MASSSTDIANLALVKLGSAQIAALTDTGKSAVALAAIYDSVRDAELRGNIWKFAMTRTTLPAEAEAPEFGYGQKFTIPADCLRLVVVGNAFWIDNLSDYRSAGNAPFEIDGANILTDLGAPLPIRYVKRDTDVGGYDALFVQALACRLAMEVAEALTQSPQKRQLAAQEYMVALKQARRVNAIERAPETAGDDSWVMSRL
ncbi:MAG: hypothetical protein JWP35_4670 [Caulobacter sp.]|nr:hypothetical protein [Caulobacter sp.]